MPRVSLDDDKGLDLVALGAGSRVTIEMDVEVRTPQDDFVFGVGIYHADGTCVYGTNTELEVLMPEKLDANGRVQFVIPSLDPVSRPYPAHAPVPTKNG